MHGTGKGSSLLQNRKSSESGDFPLERFGINGEMSGKMGWRNGNVSQKMRNDFGELWRVPGLG